MAETSEHVDEFGDESSSEEGSYSGRDDGDEGEEEGHHVGVLEPYQLEPRQQEIPDNADQERIVEREARVGSRDW